MGACGNLQDGKQQEGNETDFGALLKGFKGRGEKDASMLRCIKVTFILINSFWRPGSMAKHAEQNTI